MKLNDAQASMVEDQLDAMVLPEDHPVNPDLKKVYGDHTFILDDEGLNIIEPNSEPLNWTASVIKLATWTNDARNELLVHEPEILGVTVEIGPEKPDVIH